MPSCVGRPPEEVLVRGVVGEGWTSEEAVASALYALLSAPDDFAKAVLLAVNIDGDSDTVAAITGSVVGPLIGSGGIPVGWRERVENREDLGRMPGALWRASGRRSQP